MRALFVSICGLGVALQGLGTAQALDAAPAGSVSRPGDPTARAERRALRLGVYLDAGWRMTAGVEARVAASVAEASTYLEATSGLAVQVQGYRAWTEPVGGTVHRLGAALETQEDAMPWPEAEVVVLFTSAPPARARDPEELAWGRFGSRFAVVRSLGRVRDVADVAGLRASEAVQVARVIGRTFGALPLCDEAWLVADLATWPRGDAPVPPPSADNQRLLQVVTGEPSFPGGAEGLPRPAALRLAELLQQVTPEARRCAPREVEARRALFAAIVDRPPDTSPRPVPVPGGTTARGPDPASSPVDEGACDPTREPAPDDPALRCVALALESARQDTRAIRLLRAHLDAHPRDAEVRRALARALGRSGDDAAALAVLRLHVLDAPDDVSAWLNLGIAAARLGRLDDARGAWRRVLSLAPGHPDATALLKTLGR